MRIKVPRSKLPAILAGYQAAQAFFAPCFDDGAGEESLWVAQVDSEARCLHLGRHDGGSNAVGLPVRTIIAGAARLGSAGVVLAHNHPSGDPTPSASNCRATRALACAGEAMELAVADHLVFAGGECRSFPGMGLPWSQCGTSPHPPGRPSRISQMDGRVEAWAGADFAPKKFYPATAPTHGLIAPGSGRGRTARNAAA